MNKPCPVCQRCRRHRCRPDARQYGAACATDGNACTRDVCAGGLCTHPNEPAGTACPDDGDPCTKNECDGSGACTHPPKDEGAPCAQDKTCQGGVCTPCTQRTCSQHGGEGTFCGTFADDCDGPLDCGNACHACFTCGEADECVYVGGEVCGVACCSGCCVTPGTGLCGSERCTDGDCCPSGFNCCNGTRNGSPRSTCYNVFTYCQGRGVVCCQAGNTCCGNERCCTDDDECTGGTRCNSGCCNFNG